MHRERIRVSIAGEGAAPEAVSASELAKLLTYIETALLSYAEHKNLVIPDGAALSLVDIEPGSERLVFAAVTTIAVAVAPVAQAVLNPDETLLPVATRRALHDIGNWARRTGWRVQFEQHEALGVPSAAITPEKGYPAPTAKQMEGRTTVVGRCIRVGGVVPKVDIRPLDGSPIQHLAVPEAVAQQLARRLYEIVAIGGDATWDANTWDILEFRDAEVLPYTPTDPVLAFEELARAAAHRWDEVDAVEYVGDIRSAG